jgi:methyl-accepting chemotaxis protein|tara:strand:- start:173 stop:427 length:255 start_codon:yes stop_codon:yes gene_type:complete
MIYFLILFILLTLVEGYVIFNLTRKVERLETWVEDYAQRINDTNNVLKEIDSKGTFEADDEIGVVFTAIKETVEELNEITEEEL